ncbi:hypothetical protein EV215_1854 [Hypnocyclicus thermotrophus]|uniref:Uncharacterized protein n=1 Tax=Hypnocyclicus thermotrophus TaxID=1627895 RepID=A0AA46DX38_9FUSO|nr:hypothetical protein [Hypnocyclicus thermotrophus]TDT67851.1 hypothetical protein EV215_1854 [Hypnocyclicus thermotrophus]
MKKYILILILTLSFISCTAITSNATTHPIIRERREILNTEIRVQITVADNISTPRLDNYNLRHGTNYLKVPLGIHNLYWSKKGKPYIKEIKITEDNRKFIIF